MKASVVATWSNSEYGRTAGLRFAGNAKLGEPLTLSIITSPEKAAAEKRAAVVADEAAANAVLSWLVANPGPYGIEVIMGAAHVGGSFMNDRQADRVLAYLSGSGLVHFWGPTVDAEPAVWLPCGGTDRKRTRRD
jgi:hypothetical protein